ncbi:MAG: CBS domain-containing protein [Nanobdellota archaeon]
METGYKVSDVMTEVPVVVEPERSLEECAAMMVQKKVGTLIIKNDDKLEGIISERDIVRKAIAKASSFTGKGKDITKISAKDVMVDDVVTIDPNKDIFEAIKTMKDYDIRHLPVIHENKLAGILTMKDVLRIEPQLFDILVEKMNIKKDAEKPINKVNEQEGICEICGEYAEKVVRKNGNVVCERCIERV